MAVGSVFNLSTCDIHLLRTGMAGATTFQMVVFADITTNNISNHADTSLIGFDATIATAAKVGGANPHILFTAAADGETIGKVRHVDTSLNPNVTWEFLVRVRVHQSLSEFWIGNNQVTIHEGMSNYVLSVFAKFSDGTRGDISGHPYVTYTSNAAAATIDNVGRLRGVSGGPAKIDVKVGTTTKSIDVRVVGPVTTNRPIVRRLHGSGVFTDRRNILFLGEGFSNVADFDRVAAEIKDRLTTAVSHSPYDALRDSYNIWTACEPQDHPAPEDGITFTVDVRVPTTPAPTRVRIGNPVPPAAENPIALSNRTISLFDLVSLVGLPTSWLPSPPTTVPQAVAKFGALRNFDGVTQTFPAAVAALLDQPTLDAWLELREHGPVQARNSKLGICHGNRLGERRGIPTSPSTFPHKNRWYLPAVPQRSLVVDNRRRELGFSFFTFTNEYLSSLKLAGATATDPNFNIGPTWAAGGADAGLACMIVNDGYLGGTQVASVGAAGTMKFFASPINVHRQLTVPAPTPATSPILNHTTPSVATTPFEVMTVLFSHELTHVLNLLDEYEGTDDPTHTSVVKASATEIQEIRASSNITLFQDVQNTTTAGKFDARRAKWNLDRIELASPLAAAVTGAGVNTFDVKVKAGQGNRWRNVMTQQQQVFLRHPDLTRDPTAAGSAPLGPMTVDASSSLATDTLTLKLTGSNVFTGAFPVRSTLYLPRRDKSNTIQRVIHPSVIAHIAANGPFAPHAPRPCEQFREGPENPPATIANFTRPLVAAEAVGLYEGGGTWTCRTFRACGSCRMRDFDPAGRVQLPFCFVCKYMLVNLLDPSAHDVIDAQYP